MLHLLLKAYFLAASFLWRLITVDSSPIPLLLTNYYICVTIEIRFAFNQKCIFSHFGMLISPLQCQAFERDEKSMSCILISNDLSFWWAMIVWNANGQLLIKLRESKFVNHSITKIIKDFLFNWNQFIYWLYKLMKQFMYG